MKALSLFELNSLVRETLELTFSNEYWVRAEISELRVNRHCYMELVQKDSHKNGIIAKARAQVWANRWAFIKPMFEDMTHQSLAAGMQVLVKAEITFHELYGYSLNITDIDPTYTLGDIAKRRQEILRQLAQEGISTMNQELPLPRMLQRIAIISSATAAGYQDFCRELMQGGYDFSLTLFEAVVQGERAELSIIEALSRIAEREEEFDVVVMIRGGGSTSDLSCFNSYHLCTYVAQFPLPVLTGIGHDKDESVADMVAHTSLKTPTAVAAWLTQQMQNLEGWLESTLSEIEQVAKRKLQAEELRLVSLRQELMAQSRIRCQRESAALELRQTQLWAMVEQILPRQKERLRGLEQVVESHSPKRIMQLGFAVVRQAGGALTSTDGLKAGEQVQIEFAQGRVEAEVTKILKK